MNFNDLLRGYAGIIFRQLEIPRCRCGELKRLVGTGINSMVYYCENLSCVDWHYPTEISFDVL